MSGALLIVDGDIGSCEEIVENLADIEQEILLAHDCGHALDIYMSRRPRYMLIDINLPDHDGISLAQMVLGIDYKSIIFLISDNPISLIRAGRQQLGIA
ncbi:MAG: response regulator, partial [Methylocystaceae bacterium]|nr:response regulator [Methylocystaceae bacterium]